MICDNCKFNDQDCVIKDNVISLNLQSCKFHSIKLPTTQDEEYVVRWEANHYVHSNSQALTKVT
jgi:hypothetical protein